MPSGLAFATGTRRITGTPTAAGSGTIRIRATNSQGSDDWTVAYTTVAALAAPGLPSTPTLSSRTTNSLTLATTAGSGGAPSLYRWRYSTNATVSNTDPFVTSTTPSVTISSLNVGDDYWIDVRAENSAGESSYTSDLATSTLAALTVPSFTDDTGTAQSWTVGTSIAAVQVPAASGNPTPAYAVVGGLPSGLAFATGTRRITGTPTAAGSGTIRIRATNSQGSDDWTVTYTAAAAQTAPAFADNTGDAQSWFTGVAITSLTVPAATGTPTPTYAAVGGLPSGISFSTFYAVLSGTPTGSRLRHHTDSRHQFARHGRLDGRVLDGRPADPRGLRRHRPGCRNQGAPGSERARHGRQ